MHKVTRLILSLVLASTAPALTTACSYEKFAWANNPNGVQTPITMHLKERYYQALAGAIGLEQAASLAVDMKVLKPGTATAIKVADGLQALKKAMDLADKAYKTGQSWDLDTQIGAIKSNSTTIKSVLGIK